MSKIIDELQSWLTKETNIDNILTYTRVFNEPKSPDFAQLSEDLLNEIRQRRYRIFNQFFELESVLPEFIALEFFRNIDLENQTEIIQKYKDQYPKYFTKQIRAIYQEDINSIKQYLNLWANYLYFTNGQLMGNLEPYLVSLCKMEETPEQVRGDNNAQGDGPLRGSIPRENDIFTLNKEVYKEFLTSFSNNNYERHIPDLKLKQGVKKILQSLTFLPVEVVDDIAESRFDQRTYDFIRIIHYAINGLQLAIENNIDLNDFKAVLHNLWADMTFDKEYELSMTNKENFDILPDDKNMESLMKTLLELLTHTNITSGLFQTQVNQYAKNLTPEQDKEFKRILKVVMKGSPLIQMLFEPLDIDYFINRISDLNMAQSREQVIDEMRSKVLEDFWPETRKVMLMMAAIF